MPGVMSLEPVGEIVKPEYVPKLGCGECGGYIYSGAMKDTRGPTDVWFHADRYECDVDNGTEVPHRDGYEKESVDNGIEVSG